MICLGMYFSKPLSPTQAQKLDTFMEKATTSGHQSAQLLETPTAILVAATYPLPQTLEYQNRG